MESETIGILKFDFTLYEQEIGGNVRYNPKSGEECKIEVFPNEGDIPHFHVTSKDKAIDCCVTITTNNFFIHGTHQGRLNKTQCKELDKWLRKTNKKGISNWELIKTTWISFKDKSNQPIPKNIKDELDKTTEQPDYTKMDKYRSV